MALTLEALLQDRPPVVTTTLSTPLQDTLVVMLEHDYSQLPVVEEHPDDSGRKRVVGVVSTTSISRAGFHTREPLHSLRVEHALEDHLDTAYPTDELLLALERSRRACALVVLNKARCLVGILTDFDFADHLRRQSQDLLLTANVETTVKQLIQRAYADLPDEALANAIALQEQGGRKKLMGRVRKVVNDCLRTCSQNPQRLSHPVFQDSFESHLASNNTSQFEDLTFFQFNVIFLGKACWEQYAMPLGLPKAAVQKLLDEARKYRNRLAHHRGNLTAPERHRLIYLQRQLDRVLDEGEVPATAPEEPPVPAPPKETYATEDQEETTGFDGLKGYLQQRVHTQSRLRLTFQELNALLSDGLPGSAKNNRSWWANDAEQPQALAWLDAGWRVVTANLSHQHVTFAPNTEREKAYIGTFTQLFSALDQRSGWHRDTPSPSGSSRQAIAYLPEEGGHTARFILAFTRDGFRVDLNIDAGNREKNKAIFDALHQHKPTIQAQLGESPISWERQNDRQYSRVALYYPEAIGPDRPPNELDSIAEWLGEQGPAFFKALRTHYPTADVLSAGEE